MKEETGTKKQKRLVFKENPCDIETIFESLSVASDSNLELLFMDMLVNKLRNCEKCDLTNMSYDILKELNIIK